MLTMFQVEPQVQKARLILKRWETPLAEIIGFYIVFIIVRTVLHVELHGKLKNNLHMPSGGIGKLSTL